MLVCQRYAEHVKSDLIKSKETNKRPVIGPSVKRDLSKISKNTNVNPKRPSNLCPSASELVKRAICTSEDTYLWVSYLGTIHKSTNYLADMCRSGGLPNVPKETCICKKKTVRKTYVLFIRPKLCLRLICILLLSGELPVMYIYKYIYK